MLDRKKKLLIRIRIVAIFFAGTITLLAIEFLLTNYKIFEYSALSLAVFGLSIISLMVSRVIQEENRSAPQNLP